MNNVGHTNFKFFCCIFHTFSCLIPKKKKVQKTIEDDVLVYFASRKNMGASTIKWIAPNPCLVLSESDSKLCTNFEFCKGEKKKKKNNRRHSINILIYKAKKFMMTKQFQ